MPVNLVDLQLSQNPRFTGEIAFVKHADEHSGFHILEVKLKDGATVTVKGTHQSPLAVGDALTVSGVWERHHTYGAQVNASELAIEMPASGYGIYLWLARGKIKDVGERTAKKLYDTYGDDLLNVLESDADLTPAGITKKRANAIRNTWADQRDIAKLESYLLSFGITKAQVRAIVRQYGGAGYQIVTKNPWRLSYEIEGIGFQTADKIGLRAGLGMQHPERIKSGVLQALENLANENGHVFYPRKMLVHNLPRLLKVSHEHISVALDDLQAEKKIVIAEHAGRELVYTRENYLMEKAVAIRFAKMLTRDMPNVRTDQYINSVAQTIRRKTPKFIVTDGLRAAVEMVFNNPFSILTGGPGTGKTKTVEFIVKIAEALGLKIALAAPTGMASNRMETVTEHQACTIHSLFKISPEARRYLAEDEDSLDCDLLILDEYSMVNLDNTLAAIRKIGPTTRVLFVGDDDQLPAIGKGKVLSDLLTSGCIPSTRLDIIHRTAGLSGIPDAAKDVKNGVVPKNNRNDFQLFYEGDSRKIHEGVVRLVTELLPMAGYEEDDIMVLAPMKKGPTGTIALNSAIKQALRPVRPASNTPYISGKDNTVYSIGDPVLQQKSREVPTDDEDRNLKLVNGDVGRIVAIHPEAQGTDCYVSVDYNLPDGVLAHYSRGEIHQFIPAYAKTIHKAQGSENRVVIVPLHSDAGRMLERALFYTAITRGKEKVIVIGDEAGLKHAVENTQSMQRYTLLSERVPAYVEKLKLEMQPPAPQTQIALGV